MGTVDNSGLRFGNGRKLSVAAGNVETGGPLHGEAPERRPTTPIPSAISVAVRAA